MKEFFKKVWAFCSYLFVPQMGRNRRRRAELKQQITTLIGQERADGNVQDLTPAYISQVLCAPIPEVESILNEMGLM